MQSSDDAARASRLAALAASDGYLVRIRGLLAGREIDEERCVMAVRRALSTVSDWTEVCRIGSEEARIILSNTGDRGYHHMPADEAVAFDQAVSYLAKLFHLLAPWHF